MLAKIRLPRFFSYQFFKNAKIGVFNTAASIQPNPFWFWEKYHSFFVGVLRNIIINCDFYREVIVFSS